MNDILNQRARTFFDEADLFNQTINTFTENNNTLFPEVKKTSSFSNNVYYGETVRGMTHVSPILQKPLANANSHEIAATYYIDADKINKEKKNLISDVDTDDEFIEFITKTVFHDTERNGKHDIGEYSFELKIFISKNGNKVTESYHASKVANDEILLFIEHGDDLFSTKKMYAKIGKNTKNYINENKLYAKLKNYLSNTDETSVETSLEISPLTIDQLKELLEKGSIQTTYDFIKKMLVGLQRLVSFPSSLIGKVLVEIGDLISYLTISEKYWDASSEEYEIKPPLIDTGILEKITDNLSKINVDDKSKISKIIQFIHQLINKYNEYVNELIKENGLILESLSEKIAYICGIWNGLVDFVSGTLKFFGEYAQLLNKSSEEREVIYEQLDNFIELLSKPNLFEKLKQNYDIFINELKTQLFDKDNQLNWVRIHYITGFTVTFIASLFIPIADLAALEKLGKIGKTITELLQSLGAKVTQEANALGQMVKNNGNALLKASQDVLSLIAKGGNDLIDFIKNLAKKLADWFLKNKERFGKFANRTGVYAQKYVGRKLQPLVNSSRAFSKYGDAGRKVVQAVDENVENLINSLSKKKLEKVVMVSGMILKKGGKTSKVFTRTNFTKIEIGNLANNGKYLDAFGKPSVYQKFLDDMHPVLRKRFEKHLEEISKGLNASADDIARAGKPGSHGEIRALDDLLKNIDQNGTKYGDDVFNYIYGYNRFLPKKGVQPPCAHCHFITHFVNYIGL